MAFGGSVAALVDGHDAVGGARAVASASHSHVARESVERDDGGAGGAGAVGIAAVVAGEA
ncbi:hypothetical protein ACGFYQ_37805 [Streptomyces sp. NPDC048258]|uniref:hypothetical protein n=1 Tax=Streptomyces sp. NPDC048258 TaxID=3365527 RepID=UPI003716FBAA